MLQNGRLFKLLLDGPVQPAWN